MKLGKKTMKMEEEKLLKMILVSLIRLFGATPIGCTSSDSIQSGIHGSFQKISQEMLSKSRTGRHFLISSTTIMRS
jgi:hypothetical protein